MSTTSFWTERALREQLAALEVDPIEFDLPAMLARMNDGTTVSWFELIDDHHVARRTTVACPEWCDLEPGHRYFIDNEPGEPQGREHRIDCTPADVKPSEGYEEIVSVQVLVPELRQGSDDATATLTLPHLWVNVSGSFGADDARKIAAALLAAADKMTEMKQ